MKQDIKELRIDEDGVRHINIHPEGNTELGKLLSHFPHTPFTHPFLGPFRSMEGFWYYMRSGENLVPAGDRDDQLRYLIGYSAKAHGKNRPLVRYPDFREDVMAANYQKIIQNVELKEMVIESELPFVQYYVVKKSGMIVKPLEHEWLCEGFEKIREALKFDQVPLCWSNAEKRYSMNVTDQV
jgi:hypothetical protein